MQRELAKIIVKLMEFTDDYYEEDIVKGIRSLKDNWPNLKPEEKEEVEAVAEALEIVICEEEEDEEEEEEIEDIVQHFDDSFETQSKNKSLKKSRGFLELFTSKNKNS